MFYKTLVPNPNPNPDPQDHFVVNPGSQIPMSQPAYHQPMETARDAAVTISSQLMVASVIFLFMVVVFTFFLYLCAKYYMGSNPARRRSRARLIFAAADQIPAARLGLDAEVLKSLPITVFKPSEFKDGLECAVCLSELSEGEEARILPKCNHGFHVDCIDMWFHSHTTCPLCRAPVTGESEPLEVQPREGVSAIGNWTESLNFPTNVLFWGNQDAVSNGVPSQVTAPQEGPSSSSSSRKPEGLLVIDIPRRATEEIVSPLPMSRFPAEEMKSPMEEKTPTTARLRSFRRLLSRGKMVMASSCSPRGGDIEQGIGGVVLGEGSSLTPKTPASNK